MWGKDGVGRDTGGKKGLKKGNQEIGVGSRECICKVRKAVGLYDKGDVNTIFHFISYEMI